MTSWEVLVLHPFLCTGRSNYGYSRFALPFLRRLEQHDILRELLQKGCARGPTRKVTGEDVQEIEDMIENDRIMLTNGMEHRRKRMYLNRIDVRDESGAVLRNESRESGLEPTGRPGRSNSRTTVSI